METKSFLSLAAIALFFQVSTAAFLGEVFRSRSLWPSVRSNNFRDVATTNYVELRQVIDQDALDKPYQRRQYGRISRDVGSLQRRQGYSRLSNVEDVYYVVDLTVGAQSIPVTLDTGSSDTWFAQQPVSCAVFMGPPAASNCGFGVGFKGNFSQGMLENRTFGRSYTDGTWVYGMFGFEDVTLGGVTIKHQQLALVKNAYWWGDGSSSGLLGLAYPMMTGVDDVGTEYDPVFTSMWKSKAIGSAVFTLGLSRANPADPKGSRPANESNSFLAFGGLPPVDYDNSTWAKAPIQSMRVLTAWGLDTDVRGLYVMYADSYVYGKTNQTINSTVSAPTGELIKNTTQFPITVDCGSTLTRLPTGLAVAIYNSFDPPAQYLSGTGLFYAPCNATIPKVGVQIGSQIFYMSPHDVLRQNARDRDTGTLCRVGITDSDDGPHILGVTFLTNVVTVFDVGNNEMRFAARKPY